MKHSCRMVAAALFGASALRRTKQRDCFSVYDGKTLLRFSSGSSDEMMGFYSKLEELDCVEVGNPRGKALDAICSSSQAKEMKSLYGEKLELVDDDAGALLRNTSGVAHSFSTSGVGVQSNDFYLDWRTFESRTARVADLVANSGGVATLSQIGTSVEGRPIMVVRFRGAGWTPGAPRTVVDCELHAREWITGMSCVYAIEKAIEKAKSDPSWLAGMEFAIIPMANPDGVIYSETDARMWRKNRADNNGNRCKGVDLNRNWDPDWAGRQSTSGSLCSDVYYGPSAFSEPETQAVKRLIDEGPVTIHLDIHSYGNIILAPWGYTNTRHPRRDEIDVPGNMMRDAINAKRGESYRYGGSELLYPASGVCPDYSTSQGAFGYTYELRPGSAWGTSGFAPNKDQILPTAEECFEGILAAILYTKDPSATPAPPPPTPAPPPSVCPSATSTGPDSDGDCRCNSGLTCYENGSSGCTFSYTASYGYTSTRWFLSTCDGCQCQ